ncbi:MAG: sulfurtransferase [Deltaproteobacteria bacterium]|nr:sulfurtransferase [Deltaproteobacteria bacterium]
MKKETSPLVGSEWLGQHLQDNDLRIVDCRWMLGKPGEGKKQYEEGHIPGAIHLDVDGPLSGKEGPGRHPLPDKRGFQAVLEKSGIGHETVVVAYDNGQGAPASRLWWLLRYYGHPHVSVLDGGWNSWIRSGGKISREIPVYSPATFIARPKKKWVVDKRVVEAVRDDPEVLLIDARTAERYRGEIEPIDPRPGHIPGAINLPFTEIIDPETGLFLKPEQLRKKFEQIGADQVKTMICYCGSGVTACTNLLALRMAGFEGKLYEGSWSDWSADKELPAAQG